MYGLQGKIVADEIWNVQITRGFISNGTTPLLGAVGNMRTICKTQLIFHKIEVEIWGEEILFDIPCTSPQNVKTNS